MKMNKKLLLTASVFFVLLVVLGCGLMTVFYIDPTISRLSKENTFSISISDPHNNLSWIDNGEGPSLFLGYIVTDNQDIDYYSLTNEFSKQYIKKPFGNHIKSSYATGPILDIESKSLKLFAFSGTTLAIPDYHATAIKTDKTSETFTITPVNDGSGSIDFRITLDKGHYSLNQSSLVRYNGQPFTQDGTGNLDYILPPEIGSSKYCHFFAALNAGKGTFNNIYWSDMKYLGYIELPKE
jgi:hypothetical protein